MTSKSLPASGGSYARAKDGSLKIAPKSLSPSSSEKKANIAAEKTTTPTEKEG